MDFPDRIRRSIYRSHSDRSKSCGNTILVHLAQWPVWLLLWLHWFVTYFASRQLCMVVFFRLSDDRRSFWILVNRPRCCDCEILSAGLHHHRWCTLSSYRSRTCLYLFPHSSRARTCHLGDATNNLVGPAPFRWGWLVSNLWRPSGQTQLRK